MDPATVVGRNADTCTREICDATLNRTIRMVILAEPPAVDLDAECQRSHWT
jgi:hypothetical protein